MVARPVELALVLEVLSTTVPIAEVVVISLAKFTLVLSKVNTTLAKEMLLVLNTELMKLQGLMESPLYFQQLYQIGY